MQADVETIHGLLDKRLLMTAAVDLDALLNAYTNSLAQGGNYLLTNP